MCCRYVRFTPRKTFAQLAGIPIDLDRPFGETVQSWNIAPGSACPLVRCGNVGTLQLDNLLWGLIPHWIKDRPGTRPINARIETAAEDPTFRRIFWHRRALICANGWYSVSREADGAQPYYVHFTDSKPFCFGGLWDEWPGPEGTLPTFTILTQPSAASVVKIGERLPLIIAPANYQLWLDKNITDSEGIFRLCEPPAADTLIVDRISIAVNDSSTNGPDLVRPLPGYQV